MNSILSAVVAATLGLAVVEANADGAPGERQVALEIESKTLAEALDQWAQQSGFQIVVKNWPLAQKLAAPQLKGKFTARAALEQLLDGSPLTYDWLSDNLVSIRERQNVSSPASWHTIDGSVRQHSSAPVAKFVGDGLGEYAVAAVDERAGRVSGSGTAAEGYRASRVDHVEEVVVTGTHIRGVTPVGSSLIVMDRTAIEASGHGRLQDLLETLPQNFSGSASEDYIGDLGSANLTRGQAVDLRGLGASSTLVLVNGRRQPAGGLESSFVDISSIAASAVDRVEVLADGASALYGSDAIAGVVNFVLRKDYEGFETAVRYGTADGNADEIEASLLGGGSWSSGNMLIGYQYSKRDALMAADTPYTATNRDYRSLGGDDFRTPIGNPGTIYDPVTFLPAYAIPRGQDGTNLTVADLLPGQSNYLDDVSGVAALPEQEQHSAFLSISQNVSDRVDVFVETRYGRRRMTLPTVDYPALLFVSSANPFFVDPFGVGFAAVGYAFANDLGAISTQSSEVETETITVGGVARLTDDWQLNASVTYGHERDEWRFLNIVDLLRAQMALEDSNPATALNIFGDHPSNNPATIDSIRRTDVAEGESTVKSATVVTDGSLFSMPAGAAKLAVGIDYRDEKADSVSGNIVSSTGIRTNDSFAVGQLDRTVKAAFAEVTIPLIGRGGSRNANLLDVSLAGRYEEYSDFGSTFNPKFGVDVRPLDGLRLRGSWGTSFRAPRFNEISPTRNQPQSGVMFSAPDPRSPTGTSDVLFIAGVNPDLKEETADVWSTGFDITPPANGAFSFSATYFSVDYKDKIATGGAFRDTLLFEDQWAEIINRDPTQAEIDAVCSRPDFADTCVAPAAIVDLRLRNLAVVRVRGVDADVGYSINVGLGRLGLGLSGTYMFKYDQAVSSTSSHIDVLDTVNNPLALRVRTRATWTFDRWDANAFVNYADDYRTADGTRRIDSWTTVDVSLGYEQPQGGWIGGMAVQLAAANLFDKKAPFVNSFFGYDPANASQVGRTLSLRVTKRW